MGKAVVISSDSHQQKSLSNEDKRQLLLNLNASLNGSDSFNGSEVWVPPAIAVKETVIVLPADQKPKLQPASSKVPEAINGNRKTLKMTKENVTLLQKALNKAGFYTGEYDGVFDTDLLEVIKEFQDYVDLKPDGLVDAAVIKYLDIYSFGCESAYALKISISNL